MKVNGNDILENFTKVIQFKVIHTLSKNWRCLEDFKKDWDFQASVHKRILAKQYVSKDELKRANRIFKLIWTGFNVKSNIIRSLTQSSDGSRNAKQVKKMLDRNELVYVGKTTIAFKSGKRFEADSWFYIPISRLEQMYKLRRNTYSNPFDLNSGFYTDLQRKLIKKYIFKYNNGGKHYENA